MSRGRPAKGIGHVDGLDGPEEQKRRLRVILATLTGERSVAEACALLELSEARFHELRQQALAAALAGLDPGPSGRPRRQPEAPPTRVGELEDEVRRLRIELQAARVRTEIALVMPQLLDRKKNATGRKAKKKRRR